MRALGAVLLFLSFSTPVAADALPDPIVVELFTSQGCSSCPAADQLLTRLSQQPPHAHLIPLAYHVDYWNDLGWVDLFAARPWTQRQEAYVVALRTGRPYTPQLVVNGRWECVGSSAAAVQARLAAATRQPFAAHVALAVFPQPTQRTLLARTTTTFRRLTDQAGFEVWVVVYESGLTTAVRGGENNGRVLAHDFVVRHLERVGVARTALDVPQEGAVKIAVPAAWQWEQLGVVALVQHPDSRAIEGAARVTIGDSH